MIKYIVVRKLRGVGAVMEGLLVVQLKRGGLQGDVSHPGKLSSLLPDQILHPFIYLQIPLILIEIQNLIRP